MACSTRSGRCRWPPGPRTGRGWHCPGCSTSCPSARGGRGCSCTDRSALNAHPTRRTVFSTYSTFQEMNGQDAVLNLGFKVIERARRWTTVNISIRAEMRIMAGADIFLAVRLPIHVAAQMSAFVRKGQNLGVGFSQHIDPVAVDGLLPAVDRAGCECGQGGCADREAVESPQGNPGGDLLRLEGRVDQIIDGRQADDRGHDRAQGCSDQGDEVPSAHIMGRRHAYLLIQTAFVIEGVMDRNNKIIRRIPSRL